MKKGSVQIDFIIAISVFIGVFAITIQTMTTFFKNAESTSEIDLLKAQADSLLSIIDFDSVPANWDGSGEIERLSISTDAYRFSITLNNIKPFYNNQSENVTDLLNEIVSFNYSETGFRNIDINPTTIYDGDTEVPYSIDSDNITFTVNIGANAAKTFTIYFDDDSNFTSRSVIVSGTDFLRETLHSVQPLRIIQYRKLQALNVSNYSSVKNSLNIEDFRIVVNNVEKNPPFIFFQYGGDVPKEGNIVALNRYSIFQNSTSGIIDGRLTVLVW